MKKDSNTATAAEAVILNALTTELFPTLQSLKKLLIRVQKLRIVFPLYSRELLLIEKEYKKAAVNFFEATCKLKTPDELFENVKDRQERLQGSVTYMNWRKSIDQITSEGVSYIEIIDRALDRKHVTIQNFRTQVLALTALLVSILSFLSYHPSHEIKASITEHSNKELARQLKPTSLIKPSQVQVPHLPLCDGPHIKKGDL